MTDTMKPEELVTALRAGTCWKEEHFTAVPDEQATDDLMRQAADTIERMGKALEEIAHGPVGKLDPLGDGGTYCLTGNEWLDFRNIARAALEGKG